MARKRLAKNRGLPPNLYQNTAGYFYFINPRDKKTKGLGRDKAKACAEARAANAVLATMTPASLADWVSGKTVFTVAEWLPLYKDLWMSKTKPKLATLRMCETYLRKIESAPFASRRLTDVTTAQVAQFIEDVAAASGDASAGGLRTRLQDIFRWAETQGLIDQGRNPVSATYTPKVSVKRERLSLEQFRAIRAQAPLYLQRAMDLALMTAQRREDITLLQFSAFKDGFLHIEQGKSGGTVRLRQDGSIRLSAYGMTIADAVSNCRDMIVSRYMVHHTEHVGRGRPGAKLSPNGLTDAFAQARDAAGITSSADRTPPTFHEIRSLAERLYREEYGAEFAQRMLGHKTAKMTDRYDDVRGEWLTVGAK